MIVDVHYHVLKEEWFPDSMWNLMGQAFQRGLSAMGMEMTLEEAIANGWITTEQAEWMDARMNQMWDRNSGFEDGHCGGRGGFPGTSPWQDSDN